MTITNLVRNLCLLLQCCQLICASNHSYGARRGFVWFIHSLHGTGGHRDCDDDDIECQQASSVRAIDIVLLAIIVVGCLCCCCIWVYARKKQNWQSRSSNGKENKMATESYNHYVSMQDSMQGACRSDNSMVVVLGQKVASYKFVEMARQQQNLA